MCRHMGSQIAAIIGNSSIDELPIRSELKSTTRACDSHFLEFLFLGHAGFEAGTTALLGNW